MVIVFPALPMAWLWEPTNWSRAEEMVAVLSDHCVAGWLTPAVAREWREWREEHDWLVMET